MEAQLVTTQAAALLNDAPQQYYTFAVLLPYLNLAMQELEEEFELNNVPATNEASAEIEVDTGEDNIGGDDIGDPDLPTDLVEIQQLWEKPRGTEFDYTPMTRVEFLDPFLEPTDALVYWAWIGQVIRFVGATQDIDVKIQYIKSLFIPIVLEDDEITLINSKTFLSYRTAALAAQFISENPSRAQELNVFALMAKDRVVGNASKGRQAITTRRRPFRAAWKALSNF